MLRETTLPALKSTLKFLTQELASIRSEPSTPELRELVRTLTASNAAKRERLDELRELVSCGMLAFRSDGDGMLISSVGKIATQEQTRKVDAEYKYWSGKCAVRKKVFREVEGMLLEGMTREDLWEKAGIEGGEE